jgi:hypothetical protein
MALAPSATAELAHDVIGLLGEVLPDDNCDFVPLFDVLVLYLPAIEASDLLPVLGALHGRFLGMELADTAEY